MKKTKKIKVTKRNDRNCYCISYGIPGYSKTFYESFPTKEEAELRAAEIVLDDSQGKLRPPLKDVNGKTRTSILLKDYLPIYIRDYGNANWGDSYHTDIVRLFNEYVLPADISELLLKDISPADLDRFYAQLLNTPAVIQNGHRDTGKTVGYSVIAKIHAALRGALGQAVKWGYITSNPVVNATIPKYEKKPREVWTPEEAHAALEVCTDQTLKCCIQLAIGCSLRIGEILGLQWNDLDLEGPDPKLRITHQLRRCEQGSIEDTSSVERNLVSVIFPVQKQANSCKTALVLKRPKSKAGIRENFIPPAIVPDLLKLKAEQDTIKEKYADAYTDFNLVFAWPNGYPIEGSRIDKMFLTFIRENHFREVKFHSLRHLSTSIKLVLSGGDIKAVQDDNGHSQAKMVTEVYGHTFDSNRRRLAKRMDAEFFCADADKKSKSNQEIDRITDILQSNPNLIGIVLPLVEHMQ